MEQFMHQDMGVRGSEIRADQEAVRTQADAILQRSCFRCLRSSLLHGVTARFGSFSPVLGVALH